MTNGLTDLLGDVPAPDSSSTPTPRLVDRLDPRMVNILTVLGFGLPLAAYAWLLSRYSVNVIVSDQWDDVTVIGHSYTHLFDWNSLWAQHNENRIFFPNLIVVFLSRTTHFNVQVEEYLSACMLVAATALLIWAHKRRSAQTPWIYYCPVAILALSIVQFENMLWGFQMAWYLVLLALAVTISLVDRLSLSWLSLGGAIAVAVVGSFSSLQGLLIWPVGLLLLYYRRRRMSYAVVWLAAASLSIVLYFYNFDPNAATPNHSYVWQHPVFALKFFLFSLGDIVGVHIPYQGPVNYAVVVFGLIVFGLAIGTLVTFGISRDMDGAGPIGIALICVGLLFAAIVTVGRAALGFWVASGSRYTTFDLLTLIGIYLTLLGQSASSTGFRSLGTMETSEPSSTVRRRNRTWLRAVQAILTVVIVIQFALGLHGGLAGARTNHTYQVQAVRVLDNIDHSSDQSVQIALDLFKPASYIRERARIAQQHDLSVFAASPDK